jgi:hypothetical protein
VRDSLLDESRGDKEVTAREDAMSMRLLLAAGLATLLLGGCRYDPHMQLYIDNVNAEKRLLEDTLWDLQYDYECKIQEVDKLRGELAQLKSGETTAGSRRSETPSAPGERPFPGIPELEPPTVEPGVPEPARDSQEPAPRKLDDLDDLEPPTLDLGDEKRDLSAGPKPVPHQAETRPRDPRTRTRAGQLTARWTPRAERPEEPPPRRIDVAENPGQPGADAAAPESGRDSAWGAAGRDAPGTDTAAQQAQRPQWRPYR